GIASALAGGAMSKLFGGGQKAASGGIQGDVLATDNNTVGMGDAGIKSAIQGSFSCAYTQGKREQFSGFNRTLDAINNVFRKFSAFHDETGRLNVDGMNIISNDGSNKLNRSRKARVSYKVQR